MKTAKGEIKLIRRVKYVGVGEEGKNEDSIELWIGGVKIDAVIVAYSISEDYSSSKGREIPKLNLTIEGWDLTVEIEASGAEFEIVDRMVP